MLSGSPYALVHEMLEVPDLLRAFDRTQVESWSCFIVRKKRLLMTGEGSSRILPAKNMRTLALQRGCDWQICTEGARQAAQYDLRDFAVIGASRSGRTRELIGLFEKLQRDKISSFGITAIAGSRLTELAHESQVCPSSPEKAVAATKSVVWQALMMQALLQGPEWKDQTLAADLCEKVLAQTVAADVVSAVQAAPIVYFCGRNDGVAEELALKTNEIVRKKSMFLEGTFALHGIEEVMQKGEVAILVEPFREELDKYAAVFATVGIKAIAIASFDTPFPTVKIPALEGFNVYLQLLAGWNLLVATGLASGVNIDKPLRARKVGNEI